MSFDPFAHSADLARLAADGYELEVTRGGHLLVKQVPYRTPEGTVGRGVVVSKLEFDGDITVNPVVDHTVRFAGGTPCSGFGSPIKAIINDVVAELESGLTVNQHLSSKPDDGSFYPDYHAKITANVALISAPARALQPGVSARTGGPCVVADGDWPFEYVDTASGRAGIGAISSRLNEQRIGIVGLGGTGSYILDLVAKCPVAEIRLFDGDVLSTHNAFRAPGAAGLGDLRQSRPKVEYLAEIYLRMKRNVIPHSYHVTATNLDELSGLSFVFLAMEGGAAKRELVDGLQARGLPFVDASIGVVKAGTPPRLMAAVEINASTPHDRETARRNIDFGEIDVGDDVYTDNIQIAELNSMAAAMSVMSWKKWAGVYYATRLHHHQHLNAHFGQLTSA